MVTMTPLDWIIGASMGLGTLGGLLDDSDEQNRALSKYLQQQNIDLSKEQFAALLPMKKASSAVETGSFLSRLLDQRNQYQDRASQAKGWSTVKA